MSGSSGDSIPDDLRKTIKDITEKVAGKYSDEDVYTVLKDCNMDPEETTQKLLYLDTFQEVKKRERKKASVNDRPVGEPRRRSSGTRSDNRYSSYNSDGGRQFNARQENGDRRSMGRGRAPPKSSTPQGPHKESNKIPAVASSVAPSNGSTRVGNRSSSHELTEHSNNGKMKDTKKGELPSLRMNQRSDLDHPGPTPTSTPTNPSTGRARLPRGSSTRNKSSHLGNSNNGSLSVSDPVLVPSPNPRNPAGAIRRETRNAAEISSNLKANGSSEGAASGDSGPNQRATLEVESKLHKLHISARQPVIFPPHLCVPEAFKDVLTFGTLGSVLDQNNTEDSKPVPTNFEKSSSTPQSSSSPISGLGEAPAHVPVNSAPSQENISSLGYDQSKEESSLLTTSTSPSLTTQSRGGVSQSSVAVSPQVYPYYRQPYAANYVPYNPYYSPLYMPPQNVAPQYSGFPHQSSAGNIYMPPTSAASGPKFPVQTVYKPGPFGYGSYGASNQGYGSGTAALTTSSGHDELKENNLHSKQEDLLTAAAGREASALQGNVYYNLPQGQALAMPQAQVGHNIHHPSQVQSLHQSQPHDQLLSLSQQQQYGDWNKKLLN